MFADLLLPMFDDEYYPDILVAELKQLILRFAKQVSQVGVKETDIYHFADQTVQAINQMKPQFQDLDSDLDDAATDYIAEAMMMVLQDQGHFDIEMEALVANRAW